jgi:hypothetical protein
MADHVPGPEQGCLKESETMSNGSHPGGATGSSGSQGSVGEGNYEVQQGDCIESIAYEHGLFWETVWNHSDNLSLKNARKDPNVLREGDRVFIPDLRPKQEPGATDRRHKFKRKGVPSKLQIQLFDDQDKPRANVDYILSIDGRLSRGKTTPDGWVRIPISPNAQAGALTLEERGMQQRIDLSLGHVDPINTLSGVQHRLNNLGFACGQEDSLDEPTEIAIRQFQAKHKLQETGQLDNMTRAKLQQEYGC